MLKSIIQVALVISISLSALAQAEVVTRGYKALKSVSRNIITKSGSRTENVEMIFQVETEAGRIALSNYRVPFSGPAENFKFVSGKTNTLAIDTNVNSSEIKISEIQSSLVGLSDVKLVSIPFSNLKVGSKVSLNYQILYPPILEGHMDNAMGIDNSSIADEEYYIYESEIPLYYAEVNTGKDFQVKSEVRNSKYVVEIRPTKITTATEQRNYTSAYVYVTTAKSWIELGKFLSSEYQKIWGNPSLEAPIQKIVDEAKKLKSSKDQVNYATKEIAQLIAYSGTWITQSQKIFPQDFKTLVKNKRGDCKDYSTVLVAVLRQLGFDAYPAITIRSAQHTTLEKMKLISSLPQLGIFNHAIVWAKDTAGKEWWIDPTNPYVMADVISSDILGNYALVLDGKSENVRFLPERNAVGYDFTFEQKIKAGTNLTEGTGTLTYNEVSFNSAAQLEKLDGGNTFKQLVSSYLKYNEKFEISVKKNQANGQQFDFTYIGKPVFTEEKGKSKTLAIQNNLMYFLAKLNRDQDSYVGEVGTYKFITTVLDLNVNINDTYQSECTVRTPWISVDRDITNVGKNLVVTDILSIKKRNVTKEDLNNEVIQIGIDDLVDCLKKQSISIWKADSEKTDIQKRASAELGPPIEKMTVADIPAISQKTNTAGLFYIGSLKLMKFYKQELAKNPKNFDIFARYAIRLARMGYIRGDYYQSAYLEEADGYFKYALANRQSNEDKRAVLSELIPNLVRLKRYTESNGYLKQLAALTTPKDLLLYTLSARLALAQSEFTLADQWISAGLKIVANKEEKSILEKMFAESKEFQGKYQEALPYYEAQAKENPNDPWSLHNLAYMNSKLKNWDKVVELEKKALSISEFGAAKSQLADAYFEKAWLASGRPQNRSLATVGSGRITNVEDYEANLMEAYKVLPSHKLTLVCLIELYISKYTREKKEEDKVKVNHFAKQLYEVAPNDKVTITLSAYLKQLVNKPGN